MFLILKITVILFIDVNLFTCVFFRQWIYDHRNIDTNTFLGQDKNYLYYCNIYLVSGPAETIYFTLQHPLL